MNRRVALLALICSAFALAGPLPYDESADARAELRNALTEAGRAKVAVLVLFGANWCRDCRALDTALTSGRNAELMAGSFRLVKVDVGNFDRNLDLAASYGNPIEKGIPAAVVLSSTNRLLYSTRAGELANARHMSETGVYDFFSQVARDAANRKPAWP